jgi:hypothetical protein
MGYGKFRDLERKLPPPVPGTHFGALAPSWSRKRAYGHIDNIGFIKGLHYSAAYEYEVYQRGYNKGFSDCLKLHVRIG